MQQQIGKNAVKEISEYSDVVIVCGSPNSSNSNRLRETSELLGIPSYIIDTVEELERWLDGSEIAGLSGASCS